MTTTGQIRLSFLFTVTISMLLCACKKNDSSLPDTSQPYKLAYLESVIYPLGEESDQQIMRPVITRNGIYSAFPEGLNLDPTTGNIKVHDSETGIKYRVYFSAVDGSVKDSTIITISGINFIDGVYKINTSDSIVNPLYNASTGNILPGSSAGSLFDEGGGCNGGGCSVNLNNAKINLAQTIRNGAFGTIPSNGSSREFTLNYRINDDSHKGSNKIKFKAFYFNKLSDVSQQVWDLLNGRNGTLVNTFNNANNLPIYGFTAGNIANNALTGKGRRPPCIVILSQ